MSQTPRRAPELPRQGALEVIGAAHRQGLQVTPNVGAAACISLRCGPSRRLGGPSTTTPQEGDARETGNDLLEELQPFASEVRVKDVLPVTFPPGRARLATSPGRPDRQPQS